MRKLAIAAALTVLASPAMAMDSFLKGSDLYLKCMAQDQAVCFGYIEGVADMIESLSRDDGPGLLGFTACLRPEVNAGQVKDVVVQFLFGHAKDRDQYTANTMVAAALSDAFPCEDAAPKQRS